MKHSGYQLQSVACFWIDLVILCENQQLVVLNVTAISPSDAKAVIGCCQFAYSNWAASQEVFGSCALKRNADCTGDSRTH